MGAGIVCIVISLFILVLAGTFKRVPNQKKVEGIIHSVEFAGYDHDVTENKGHNMYYYHIQYVVNGKEYLLKTKSSSSGTDVVGKKRTIKYNKNNPEQAIESPDKKIYIYACIFLAFGIYAIISSL